MVLGVDQNVPGLQVAVNDAVPVGKIDSEGRLPEDGDLKPQAGGLLLSPLRENRALHVFHGDVESAVDAAGFVDTDQVRVFRKVGGEPGFAEEALLLDLDGARIRVAAGQEHL